MKTNWKRLHHCLFCEIRFLYIDLQPIKDQVNFFDLTVLPAGAVQLPFTEVHLGTPNGRNIIYC